MRSVCKYSLWKRLTAMKYKKATGFVGWVTYEMKDEESRWNRGTCMLAKYAEFANIGGNKTGGYGETKYVPLRKAKQEYRGI